MTRTSRVERGGGGGGGSYIKEEKSQQVTTPPFVSLQFTQLSFERRKTHTWGDRRGDWGERCPCHHTTHTLSTRPTGRRVCPHTPRPLSPLPPDWPMYACMAWWKPLSPSLLLMLCRTHININLLKKVVAHSAVSLLYSHTHVSCLYTSFTHTTQYTYVHPSSIPLKSTSKAHRLLDRLQVLVRVRHVVLCGREWEEVGGWVGR